MLSATHLFKQVGGSMHFRTISFVMATVMIVGVCVAVSAQQEMQNIPSMKKSDTGTKKKRTTKRRPRAKSHSTAKAGTHKRAGAQQTARTKQPTTKQRTGN